MRRIWHYLALAAVVFVIAGWSAAPHADPSQTTDPTTCSINPKDNTNPFIRLQEGNIQKAPSSQDAFNSPCEIALDPGATVTINGYNWKTQKGATIAITIVCADPTSPTRCPSSLPVVSDQPSIDHGQFQAAVSVDKSDTALGIFALTATEMTSPDAFTEQQDTIAQTASPVLLVVEQTSPGNLTPLAVGLGAVAFILSWLGRPRQRGRRV